MKDPLDTNLLSEMAFFLEGIKQGQGNIIPLGNTHLEELWKTIKWIEGLKTSKKQNL